MRIVPKRKGIDSQMEKQQQEMLEDGVIFWCDPRKNVNCRKTGCYMHGGPCRFTTNPKCAKEVKG